MSRESIPSSVKFEQNEASVVTSEPSNTITKSVKFVGAFCLTYGQIIGSGIFITVKPTFLVFDSNSIGMVMIFWALGGVMALLGGLCYAELGTRMPESGGERAYYKKVINAKFAKTFVLVFVFLVKSIALAALSLTVGKYLSVIFLSKPNATIETLIAAATLILAFFLNCLSKNVASKATVLFTVLKTTALLIIVSFGIYFIAKKEATEWEKPFVVEGFSIIRLAVCFVNIFWSYEGWNTLGLVAGDMKNPRRDLPLAIITGVSAVTIFYVMVNISYSAVLGYDIVKTSETVASNFAIKVLKKFSPVIPLLICCSAAGAVIGNFFAVGSVSASAGYSGELPKIFSLVQRKTRTPIFSLFAELIVAMTFLTFDFQNLLNYSAFITWLFYLLSIGCLIKIKVSDSKPEGSNIFRVPMILIFPMILVCLFTIGLSFYLSPTGCTVFAVLIVLSVILQYIPERYTSLAILSRFQDSVCRFLQNNLALEFAQLHDIS